MSSFIIAYLFSAMWMFGFCCGAGSDTTWKEISASAVIGLFWPAIIVYKVIEEAKS